jgi:hypothetical protein
MTGPEETGAARTVWTDREGSRERTPTLPGTRKFQSLLFRLCDICINQGGYNCAVGRSSARRLQ